MLVYLFVSIATALILARKLGIGPALLLASIFLGVSSFGFSTVLFRNYFHPQSFELMVLLILTYFLVQAMGHFGYLDTISNSLNSSFGSLSFALVPLILGL